MQGFDQYLSKTKEYKKEDSIHTGFMEGTLSLCIARSPYSVIDSSKSII